MLLGELLVSLRRFIFSCRLRIGSILYGTIRERHRNRLLAQRLDRWTIAKRSFFAQYEAQAMQFVAKNTALPIPRVHDVWIDGEHETRGWIVMDYIEGRGLDKMWPQMNASQRDRVRAQLTCFL
jgi:aminoglycoside phosphotransferase (APT) family kinase protein